MNIYIDGIAERSSYELGFTLPDNLKIIIKPEEIDEIKLQEIKKQFDYYIGCSLEW